MLSSERKGSQQNQQNVFARLLDVNVWIEDMVGVRIMVEAGNVALQIASNFLERKDCAVHITVK